MTDRVSHDHPTIETVSATVARYGGTSRPEIRVTDRLSVEQGTVVRLVLGGREYYAEVQAADSDTPVLRGAYPSPRTARNPGGATNHLAEWVEEQDLEWGRTVQVDVVAPGFKYGLRAPGESATYKTGRPDEGLADIARDLDQ